MRNENRVNSIIGRYSTVQHILLFDSKYDRPTSRLTKVQIFDLFAYIEVEFLIFEGFSRGGFMLERQSVSSICSVFFVYKRHQMLYLKPILPQGGKRNLFLCGPIEFIF